MADIPAVKSAEQLHGSVGVVVMGKDVKWFGRGLPKRSQEISELLTMQIDKEDGEWEENE